MHETTTTALRFQRQINQQQAVAFGAQLALLVALSIVVGLDAAGWMAGLTYAVVLCVFVDRTSHHDAVANLGPADIVTLSRAVLACGVTAMMADHFGNSAVSVTFTAMSTVALLLDHLDGKVARRTGTVSAFGARFDMEADSIFFLVLSIQVTPIVGPMALAIGAMRYLFLAASWLVPWLRAKTPPRSSAKVVAALQGITLVVVGAGVLPTASARMLVMASLAALSWSFGFSIVWLWRNQVATA